MSTTERIDQDFKQAMKAKDELALSVLRLVRTALKNKQIELMHELSEQEAQAVMKTMVKQYQDALSDFINASRQDLADRQQKEIDLIVKYLPAAMSPEQLETVVREALKNADAKEFGKAMGIAMKAVNGQADGNDVRLIVQRILASP